MLIGIILNIFSLCTYYKFARVISYVSKMSNVMHINYKNCINKYKYIFGEDDVLLEWFSLENFTADILMGKFFKGGLLKHSSLIPINT